MIEKIKFNTQVKGKDEINLSNANILFSDGTNQAGKTTVLEMICATFLFNKDYIKDQLSYNEEEKIRNLEAVLYIGGERYQNKRVLKDGKYKFSDKITNLDSDSEITKEQFESGKPIVWPSGIRLRKIYSKYNYYKQLERYDFSFGLYYQIFYIDEKIGWNRYDVQKTVVSFLEYNKYNINFYLFSRIFNKDEVDREFELFKNKFKPETAEYEKYFELNSYLKSVKGAHKLNNLVNALKTDKDEDELLLLSNDISEISSKIIELKIKRKEVKNIIGKEKITRDIISKKLAKAFSHFGINTSDFFSISIIKAEAEENILAAENEIKKLNIEIKNQNSRLKNLKEKIHKKTEEMNDSKIEFSDPMSLLNMIKSEEIKKLETEHSKIEIKKELGINTESISKYIKENIIKKNRAKIRIEQQKIVDEIISYLEEVETGYSNKAMDRIIKQLNALRKNCGQENYFEKGAFENIQILTERLAICNLWIGEIPIMVIDSPFKAEIEDSDVKDDQERNHNINLYRKSILFLLSKFINLSEIKPNGETKINQLIISSASIKKDKKEIEKLISKNIKINWIKMDGLV